MLTSRRAAVHLILSRETVTVTALLLVASLVTFFLVYLPPGKREKPTSYVRPGDSENLRELLFLCLCAILSGYYLITHLFCSSVFCVCVCARARARVRVHACVCMCVCVCLQLVLSTAVHNKVTKSEGSAVEEQDKVHPATRAQLRLSLLDHSWALWRLNKNTNTRNL